MDSDSSSLRKLFGPVQLLGAGLFCLLLGLFLGNKLISAGHVFLILGVVGFVYKSGWNKIRWNGISSGKVPRSTICLGLFLVLSILSILVNWSLIEDPLEHLKKLRHFVLFLVLLAFSGLVVTVVEDVQRRNRLVAAWLIPMVLTIGIGIYALWKGEHPFREEEVADISRLSGIYGQVMTFAYGLQFTVIALAVFFLSPGLWKRMTTIPWWVVIIALPIAGLGMYLTYTRGAMLGVVVGFTTYGMLRSRWLVVLVLFLGILAGGFAYSQKARYFKSNNSVRVNQWKVASLSFLERPMFGLGYRNFELQSVELKKRYGFEEDRRRKVEGGGRERYYFQGHAHNNYLEAFASTGIFGGLSFLGFCYFWVAETVRSRYRILFLPLVLAFLVSGFFECTFFDSEVLNAVLVIYLFSWILYAREGAGETEPTPLSHPPSA
ncbi:MAG: O-antigen ligase family protein [Verrucomicrobiales bacterium]|nr:O-antigen ligase family protein [Verrucomicrobiales bacterium]